MKVIKDGILFFYWHVIKYLVWMVPVAVAHKAIKLTSHLLVRLMVRKARLLRAVYLELLPDGDEKEVQRSVTLSFWTFLCCEYEMLMFPKMTTANIEEHVKLVGSENLDKALAGGNKGAILVFGHFGANLMIMPAIGYNGYSMNQISAPSTIWTEKLSDRKFSKMEKYGMKKRWQHEQSLPAKHINVFGILKNVFLCLRHNEVLGVAIDGGGGSERVKVDFVNQKAAFSTGAIEIARKTGSVILPVFMCRNLENGKNELIIEKPYLVEQETDKLESNREFIQHFAMRTESYFRKYPWLYLNFLVFRKIMEPYDDIPFLSPNEAGGNHESGADQSHTSWN